MMNSEIGQRLRSRRLITSHIDDHRRPLEDRLFTALSTDFPADAAAVEGQGGGRGVLLLYTDKDRDKDKDIIIIKTADDGVVDDYKKTASPSSWSCLIAAGDDVEEEEEGGGMKTPTDEAARIPTKIECPGAPARKKRPSPNKISGTAAVGRKRSCRRKLSFKDDDDDDDDGDDSRGLKSRVLLFPLPR